MNPRNNAKRHSVLLLLFLGLVLLLSAQPAAAKQAAEHPFDFAIIDPDETEPSILKDQQRRSLDTGAPVALYGLNYSVTPAPPEEMARQYLHEHRDLLLLRDPNLADLVLHQTRVGDAGTTVRFRQHVDGVPVYESEITITIDDQHRVTFVLNGYRPTVNVATTVPALSGAQASQLAHDYLRVEGVVRHEATTLVVYHKRGASRLAYRVSVVPAVSPIGDWEVLVDALTGEIFKVVDRALYVDGSGNIFDPDPLSSAGASYGDTGFTDNGDADSTELTAELMNVTLRDIDLNAGTYSLEGPYAVIVDSEAPFNGLFTQASSAFNFNRQDDGFEAVNTYYHVDNIMRYINETLNVTVMPFQYAGGVRFDPHGFNGADNSHYVRSTGEITFGEGGVDDAEDADVVIHELGHGIHDWLTAGGLSNVDGLSEGFGDYLGQSYSRSLGQWGVADPEYNWFFNWDGHNPFWAGRITNYAAHYPDDLVGQIATDGQIWSTCLMTIWDEIGREKTDRAVLEGLAMTNSSSSQNDAANAVLQAAINLGYSRSELWSIAGNFQTTGYDVELPNDPPVAICQNVTVPADPGTCSADASVDGGSFDPDGDPLTVSQVPPGPYPLGTTDVTLVVSDPELSDSCQAQVTVADTEPPPVVCNAANTITTPDVPISFTAGATDNCGVASVVITEFDCFRFTKKGKRIDKTGSCEVSIVDDTITILESGGVGDIITWTATATDGSGNVTASVCQVVVENPGKEHSLSDR